MDTHRRHSARFKMMRSSMRRGGEAARPNVIIVGGGRGRIVSQAVSALDYHGVREHQRGMKMSQ